MKISNYISTLALTGIQAKNSTITSDLLTSAKINNGTINKTGSVQKQLSHASAQFNLRLPSTALPSGMSLLNSIDLNEEDSELPPDYNCKDQTYLYHESLQEECLERYPEVETCKDEAQRVRREGLAECATKSTEEEQEACKHVIYHDQFYPKLRECNSMEPYKSCRDSVDQQLEIALEACPQPTQAPSISPAPTTIDDIKTVFGEGVGISANELKEMMFCELNTPPKIRYYNSRLNDTLPWSSDRYNLVGCVAYAAKFGADALANSIEQTALAWGGYTQYIPYNESTPEERAGLDIYYCPYLAEDGYPLNGVVFGSGPGEDGKAYSMMLMKSDDPRLWAHEIGHDTYCLNHPFEVDSIKQTMLDTGKRLAEFSVMNYCTHRDREQETCAQGPTELDLSMVDTFFSLPPNSDESESVTPSDAPTSLTLLPTDDQPVSSAATSAAFTPALLGMLGLNLWRA